MAEIRDLNSFNSPSGFNILAGVPIDSRMYVSDIAHIYSDDNWKTVKPYPGLIVSAPDGQVRVYAPQDSQTYKDADAWLEIGGGAAIVEAKYDDALAKATEKNIGTIVYVTNNPEEGVTNPGAIYNGAYVVSGANSLSKLGTTTVGDDIAGDVATLQGKVSSLEATVNGTGDTEDTMGLTKKVANIRRELGTLDGEAIKTVIIGDKEYKPDGPDADGIITVNFETEISADSESVTNAPTAGAVYTFVEDAIDTVVGNSAVTIKTDKITEGALKSYTFYQGGEAESNVIGTIDIPKDLVVKSGSVIIATEEDRAIDENVIVGEQYIKLIVNATNEEEGGDTLYIAAKSLVDVYTGDGTYVSVDNSTNVISLDVAKVDEYVAKETSITGGLIKANSNDIGAIEEFIDADGYDQTPTTLHEAVLLDILKLSNNEEGFIPSLPNVIYELKETAESALQSLTPANENQLTVTAAEDNPTQLTIAAVTANLTELTAVGEDYSTSEHKDKLLTVGVAKEYIDSLWEWEII